MTIFPSGAAAASPGRSSSATNTSAIRDAFMLVLLRGVEGRHGFAGAPRAFGGFGGPFRGPPSGGIGREPHRLRARLVVGDDVDDGRLARRERALERRSDVVWLLDELAMRAELHGHPVVAGVAEVAAGLGQRPRPRRLPRPPAVVADDAHDRALVTDRRVDVPGVE